LSLAGPWKRKGSKALALLVKEIYPAIIGEGIDAGWPGLVARLAGCNLRCSYCDTQYAWKGGKKRSVKEVVKIAREEGLGKILLTGGEPLVQDEAIDLIAELIKAGHQVIIETNGSLSLARVPKKAHIIMDLKTPGSGEEGANNFSNLEFLKPGDELKFVLCHAGDYDWAKARVRMHRLDRKFVVNFSPAAGKLNAATLARWMVRDRLKVRLNLQVHRLLFPARSRGV